MPRCLFYVITLVSFVEVDDCFSAIDCGHVVSDQRSGHFDFRILIGVRVVWDVYHDLYLHLLILLRDRACDYAQDMPRTGNEHNAGKFSDLFMRVGLSSKRKTPVRDTILLRIHQDGERRSCEMFLVF